MSERRALPFIADKILLVLTALLVCFSLLMIYSTTAVVSLEKFGDTFYFLKRQIISVGLGILLLIGASFVSFERLRRNWPLFFLASIILLGCLFIPGLGVRAGGAQRWLNLGFMRFQPVELVKLLMVIFLAGLLARNEHELSKFLPGVVKPMLAVGLIGSLLLMQPDFGSCVVLGMVALGMMLVAGVRLRYFLIGIGAAAALAGLLVLISPYRMSRVVSFLSPFSDSSGKGYQLIQSLIAVGTGGTTGVGLGASQQKLFFLPAAHTDFIFAVVAEELGLIGCIALILAFLMIFWRGLSLSARFADDTFLSVLTIGLTLLLVIPALLNMGVVLGLLPTKGLVLPLISYGGSNLVISMATIGLLLGLSSTWRARI